LRIKEEVQVNFPENSFLGKLLEIGGQFRVGG
jgi:hypothetical protein